MDVVIDLARLLIVGLIAGSFASYRAIREHRAQQWWERKADAYVRVIEALSVVRQCYSEWYDEAVTSRQLSDEKEEALQRQFEVNYAAVTKATNMGTFLFSDEVDEALRLLRKKRSERQDTFYDHVDHNFDAISECLASLVEYSKTDLRVVGGDFWSLRRLFRRRPKTKHAE